MSPAKRRTSRPFGLEFHRLFRTASSESYVVFRSGTSNPVVRVGRIDFHIQDKLYHATVVLETPLGNRQLEHLLVQLDNLAGGDSWQRDDFIITVFRGHEIGFYSDAVSEEDRLEGPSTKKDLEDVSSALRQVLGRHQTARGQLNEQALCDYFRAHGYQASVGSSELDHKKIDVFAEKNGEIVYAQAKLGTASASDMRQLIQSVASMTTTETKIAAIAADKFPKDSEFLRRELERQHGISLICIQKYQVLEVAEKYRRVLEDKPSKD